MNYDALSARQPPSAKFGRIENARRQAHGSFVQDVINALNGMHGDVDMMTEYLTSRYDRHVAQALHKLLVASAHEQDLAERSERQDMRQEAGF